MHKITWKSSRKDGGIGRASINHFTSDGKKTLCNKSIGVKCLESKNDCKKCCAIKTRSEDYLKIMANKLAYFKEVVESHGGHYEMEGDMHTAWWDAYDDKKDMYVAYGRLAPFMDNFNMVGNCLHYGKV